MMLNPIIKLILTSIIAIVCFTKGFCQTETDSLIRNNNSIQLIQEFFLIYNQKFFLTAFSQVAKRFLQMVQTAGGN